MKRTAKYGIKIPELPAKQCNKCPIRKKEEDRELNSPDGELGDTQLVFSIM